MGVITKLNDPTKWYPSEIWDSVERVCTNLETYIPEFKLQLYQKEYEIRQINFLKPYFSYTMVWKYLPLKIVKDLNEIRYVELAGRCLIKLVSFPCLPMPHPNLPPHRENTMEYFLNDLQSYTCRDLCCSIVLTSWKFF